MLRARLNRVDSTGRDVNPKQNWKRDARDQNPGMEMKNAFDGSTVDWTWVKPLSLIISTKTSNIESKEKKYWKKQKSTSKDFGTTPNGVNAHNGKTRRRRKTGRDRESFEVKVTENIPQLKSDTKTQMQEA